MIKKILHTADLHFSNKVDKLEETIRCSNHMLNVTKEEKPDVIILSGDTVDEYDGKIKLDSPTARAAISFVQRCADIAPVVIIKGTNSHDRQAPYIFQHLRAEYPVYVGTELEQVALVRGGDGLYKFFPQTHIVQSLFDAPGGGTKTEEYAMSADVVASFTLLPSVDKSYLYAKVDGGIQEGNAQIRELLHDVLAGFGQINDTISAPCILVGHGMITGAEFSSGQTAIGEDLEFGVGDLHAAKCDYYAMGHVHKYQQFPGHIYYSGSPGRLNFGEQEEKGFLMPEFDGREVKEVKFHPTPARRFVFGEADWRKGGKEALDASLAKCVADCKGADVRFRYSINEEEMTAVRKDDIERQFMEAGAKRVKIECQILPKERVRAEGISKLEGLPEKVKKYGETVGEEIPQVVLDIAAVIEGNDVEELIAMATEKIGDVSHEEVPALTVSDLKEKARGAMTDYLDKQEGEGLPLDEPVPVEERMECEETTEADAQGGLF
ncbi:metallophosphoesterase [Candidatus Pacearchaeota archaeon]|nr:metallophosphoesterase [Candidatus Pacearchaeota archaeon]